MIEGLKPYSEYGSVVSPWVGRIPSHWTVRKLRTLVSPRNERNRPDLPLLSVARERGVFVRGPDDGNRNVIPDDLSHYKVVRSGGLVINKMKAWQGSMGIAPCDGIVSPAYFVYEFRVANREYGQALLRSRPYVAHFAQASDGVRIGQWDLSVSDMREIPIVLPPPDEQAKIVRFLRYANWRIDRLIGAKKKLVALANEQKQSIIHHAVTRGLDACGEPITRSTGERPVAYAQGRIPWLASVPERWEMVPSGQLFQPRKELAREGDEQLSSTQAYGVIPQAEFERRVGRRVVKISIHLEKRRHVERDDFVISMRSFQGGLERAWASGCIRSSYVVLRPSAPIDVGYFAYLFKSPEYIRALQATANFIRDGQDLNFDNFRLVDLPLPPISEQRAIAAYLDVHTSALTQSIDRMRRELQLLDEFRARITADVVTGQLDVRAVAAALPPEGEAAMDVEEPGGWLDSNDDESQEGDDA